MIRYSRVYDEGTVTDVAGAEEEYGDESRMNP